MKVVEVYTKKDLDILTCEGKVVSKVMNDFFSKLPRQFRENYDKNLMNAEIWKVDEAYDNTTSGEYFEIFNIIILKNFNSLVHELMHLSSCDSKTRLSSFQRKKNMDFLKIHLLKV